MIDPDFILPRANARQLYMNLVPTAYFFAARSICCVLITNVISRLGIVIKK